VVSPPAGELFRITGTDYFDGEDPPVPGAAAFSPAPPPAATPVAPFASRLIHLDAVPLGNWESPGGKFRSAYREVSLALCAKRNTPTGLGGHPFDLEVG